jgi:CcmD family protein
MVDQRNFLFMFYGFAAVWVILFIYVVLIGARERKIRKQLENLRTLVQDRDRK